MKRPILRNKIVSSLNNLRGKIIPMMVFVFALFAITTISTDIFAQNYEFSLVPRRAYDQLHIEIWARTLNSNAAKLGNSSLIIQYNTSFLTPSLAQDLYHTDTIIGIEANSPDPVAIIISEFNSVNGYSALTSGSYSAGYYSLEINHEELGVKGLQPKSDVKGSFLGILSFDIIGNPSSTDLANIAWSKSTFPGDICVFDIDGNDIESLVTFVDAPANFTIIGVTLLSPIKNNLVIDRDANYKFLEGIYTSSGYPIYFERSINPSIYTPITPTSKNIDEDLGYLFEYSLDGGTTWTEFGRAVETDKIASAAKSANYKSGEIFEPKGTAYYITTENGYQLTAANFRKPLRIIWTKDPYFIYRSELGKIRITVLEEDGTTPILSRTPSTTNSITVGNLIFGRLFFLQLNGTNNYLKTNSMYSNATQLTVSAWVNLNGYTAAGNSPVIVASSGGPNTTPIFGSNEGAWMLYLRDGRIPAFRAREILNRGDATNPNYIAIVEAYNLDTLTAISANPLSTAHSNNWVHIAATVADNVVSLYVNGELVKQVTNNNANDIRMLVTDHPIWIGVNPNGAINTGSFLNAGIKGVQVWRTALNQDQIRQYSSGVVSPDSITTYNDIKKGLELYYTFEGTTSDLASNADYQNGRQDISFYNDAMAGQINPPPATSNSINKNGNILQASVEVPPTYRPDQPHLRVSAPANGSGVSNLSGKNTEIRWVTYGMTDITKANKLNFQIKYSIDGGTTWNVAKNAAGQLLSGANLTNADKGIAVWQPYQNNDETGNLRTINPYSKTAMLRLEGMDANGNVAFISTSDTFTIAPYFALQSSVGTQLKTDTKKGMNITGDYAYIEAWIKPYRFPSNAEAYFPIVQKSDGAIHYSLRLYFDGTLAFIVTDRNGAVWTARTTTDLALVVPNSVEKDSAWTHIGVLFIRSNGSNISEARFYVDGNLQGGNDLALQYSTLIQLNTNNEYPLYIASNPAVATNSFVGEIKEVRFWNDIPNKYSIYGVEPTEFTQFVQKSLAEAMDNILNTYKQGLHSYFSFDGGTFFADGGSRVAAVSTAQNIILNNYGTPARFAPFKPFIKLVEPQFRQRISNSDKDVKVRWVGQYYDGSDFAIGAAKTAPSLEFSIRGGGGNVIQPYQYVGSLFWSGNKTNSLKLIQTNEYYSKLTNTFKYFALSLDASMANPDVNKDGNYNDQGPLSPTLTNARLRLTGSYAINGEKFPLQSEGPLFTINPVSNFTARVMLEGYHQGNASGKSINQLGPNYEQGGLMIRMYSDNSGEVGNKVGPDGFSSMGYTERDPAHLNKGNNRFGNVDFVFTEVPDGSYWLLIDHINHLPIMSRYPVPFIFTGDIPTTWIIESGWDFTSWNGVDENFMPSPSVNPWTGGYYSARGTAVNKAATNPDRYSTTGLIYNGGTTDKNGLAAMVGGDVNQDNMINAADRVKVRQEAGLMSYESDITGDKYVNATDRTITDHNFGKVSSLINTNIPIANFPFPYAPFSGIDYSDVELSNYFNFMALNSNFELNNKPNDISLDYNGLIDDKVFTLNKNGNTLQGLNYIVSAKVIYNDSGFVDLSMYIRNNGDEFAPANCTFAVSFNPDKVTFAKLMGTDSVIFNSTFDYNKLNIDIPQNGYLKLSSAPNINNPKAYNNIRSIEIDYDAFANVGGINVPYINTYLGTLRFNVNKNAGVVAFHWHESKAVFTTKGANITDEGKWDTIPSVLLYSAKVITPNGGEKYSILSNKLITWTATADAKINVEFSSNNGVSWIKLNDTAVNSNLLSFQWITPSINSNNCLIRIVDEETNIELDRSDSTFSINPPWGNILKPYANPEPYKGGSITQIEWVAGGTDCVKFEFSSDGGMSWTAIQGSYNAATNKANWTIPHITTKNAMVRMSDCESDMILSTSGKFIILDGSITFTTPTLNQKIKAYTNFKVRWARQYVEIFDLELSLDNGKTWHSVESNVDATKLVLNWIAPNENTDSAIFRALYQSDPTMEYGRSKIFKIYGTSTINELPENSAISNVYPNPVNNFANIEFNLNSISNVNIQLIDETGALIKELATNYIVGIGKQVFDFNLSSISNGNYFLLITSNDFVIIREIIKK
jgi:hypothetical protein